MAVKVECESCKSPYTIDERRIPPTGLRVRCPKCTKTFVIRKPGASMAPPASTPQPAPKPAEAKPAASPAIPKPAAAPAIPKPAAAPAAPVAAKPATPTIEEPPGIDLPAIPTTPSKPRPRAATIAFAGAPGALPTFDGDSMPKLPATAPAPIDSSVPPPVRAPEPPKAAPAPPKFEARSEAKTETKIEAKPEPKVEPAKPAASSFDDLPALAGLPPLPTASGDKPAPRNMARRTVVGLGGAMPALTGALPGVGAPAKDAGLDADLPAPAAAKPAPKGFGEIDLPAVPAKGAPKGFELDLPAIATPTKGADLPAAKVADRKPEVPKTTQMGAPPSPAAFGEIDLPAVAPPARDLPATKAKAPQAADLPAIAARAPAPTKGGFGEIDLPAVAPPARDLPAIAARAPAPTKGGFGEIDLPAVAPPARDLPAPKAPAPFGEIDLPAVAPPGRDLPSEKATSTPFGELELGGAHLPAIGGLPSPMEPSVARPLEAREPSIARPLGGKAHDDFAVAQTMVGPAVTPSRGFDLDVPAPPADLFGAPSPDLGLRSGTAQGFGELDFGASPQPSPRAATGVEAPAIAPSGGGFADFGELELPGPGTPNAPAMPMGDFDLGASPGAQTFGGDNDAPKAVTPKRAPSLMLGANEVPSFAPSDGFGEMPSIPAPGAMPSEASEMSKASQAGGMAFGEVDLGGGGGEEDMEFGAIPQETAPSDGRAAAFDRAPEEALPPRSRAGADDAAKEEATPKKKGKAGKIVLALLGVLVVAGASLEFTKYGAFARNTISDHLNADKNAALLRDATNRVQQAFGDDTLARSTEAVSMMDRDVEAAPRYAPLLAYAAYVNWAHQIRFGKDGGADAKAQALLAKAIERPGSNRDLAQAAHDVLLGNLPAARAALAQLLAQDPKNVDAAVTLGELELRANQPKDAIAAFTKAKAAQDSPRTRAGLMRAHEAAGDLESAKKEAEAIVAKSQTHIPSRLFLAHYAWEKAHDEKKTLAIIDELRKPALVAASSPSEQIDALSLKGTLLLDRGRVTDAKAAFDQAVAAAKGAPAALPQLGLGEVDMANGQYPAAIAAFKAAAEAAPDMTLAKIGIARAQLKLEKPADARATLQPLKDPKYASDIGFWLGQASEKLSPDKPQEAMKIYEAAIKAQPSEVKPYIALANLQAKAGQSDAATATLDAALKAVPPSDKLHIAVGELRFRQGRYAEALAEFDEALTLQPESLDALFDKGRTQLRMEGAESVKAGKATLDQVEKKDPKYPGLALEMGYYYQQTHQLDEALKRYQSALEAAPNDIDVKLQVGRAMVESRDPNAEATLRDVLDKCATGSSTPDTCQIEAKHYLGRALLNRNAPADAILFLKQAVEKGDSNAAYHLYYGWALKEMDRLDEADLEIARALELDKSVGDAYWLRAEILVKQQKYKDAIELAEKALKLTPSRWEAHATLAMAYKGLSNGNAAMESQAIAEWEKAIHGDPNNPKAPFWHYLIADLMYYRNEIFRAAPHLKECIKLLTERDQKPAWMPKAYFYLGLSLRFSDKEEAKKALKTYLDTSVGTTDPARGEAKAAYAEAGGVYTGQ